MTPNKIRQPQREYIITEDHAQRIWEHLRDISHGNASYFWGEIRKCLRPHTPAPDYDAIRKKVLEEVDTDDWLREKIDEEREQAASTATLTENQRIMRLIGTYLSYHGVEIHERQGEKYYVVEGTFSLASFIQYIESLRSTAGDEPEKRAEGGVRR